MSVDFYPRDLAFDSTMLCRPDPLRMVQCADGNADVIGIPVLKGQWRPAIGAKASDRKRARRPDRTALAGPYERILRKVSHDGKCSARLFLTHPAVTITDHRWFFRARKTHCAAEATAGEGFSLFRWAHSRFAPLSRTEPGCGSF